MDNCQSVSAKLQAYISHTLTPDEISSIEAHLSKCDKCRDELHKILENSADSAEKAAGKPSSEHKEQDTSSQEHGIDEKLASSSSEPTENKKPDIPEYTGDKKDTFSEPNKTEEQKEEKEPEPLVKEESRPQVSQEEGKLKQPLEEEINPELPEPQAKTQPSEPEQGQSPQPLEEIIEEDISVIKDEAEASKYEAEKKPNFILNFIVILLFLAAFAFGVMKVYEMYQNLVNPAQTTEKAG